MPLRASDAEATALGAAAAAAAALHTHEQSCYTCSSAHRRHQQDQCCDEGYEMVRTIHKANTLIAKIRADKKERRRLQPGLF
jgi:hypothetical protein